jgi:septal ring factor EnvC (AmiA/AmiB activator)
VKARIAAVVVLAFLVGAFSMELAAGQAKKPTARGLKHRVVVLESKLTNLETQLANQATDTSNVQAQLVRQASDMTELQSKTISLDASGVYQGQIGGQQVNAPPDCADPSSATWEGGVLGC